MQGYGKSEDVKREIVEYLETVSGEKIDICYVIYHKISACSGYEPELLRFFLEESEQIESKETEPVEVIYSREEKGQYISRYGKMIDNILEDLIEKKLKEEEFYRELWKRIDEETLLDNVKIKAFAVYFIWIDMRVPYFELDDGVTMNGDEYRDIRRSIIKDIKHARFILSVPVEQKTQRASRLVKLLDNMKTEEEKAVLMVQILLLNEQTNIITNIIQNGGRIVYNEDQYI